MRTASSIRLVLPPVVALVSGACFLPSLSGPFLNWDDNVNFLDDTAYRGFGLEQIGYAAVWRDSGTLWRWAVEVNPDCSVCHGKLGESVLSPGGALRVTEAEASFRRAIALRPDLPDAYFNLGSALVIQGRYAEAEQPLRSYMERVPQAAAGPERLGLLYLLQHRYEASLPLLQTALGRRPDAPELRGYLIEALQGRARELRAQGRVPEADALAAEAVALADGGGGSRPRR